MSKSSSAFGGLPSEIYRVFIHGCLGTILILIKHYHTANLMLINRYYTANHHTNHSTIMIIRNG